MITVCTSFMTLFFFCMFGEMAKNQFNRFDEKLWQCDWYIFPMDVQKLLVTFMSCTQRPAILRGFAQTECTRNAFKTVNFNFFKSIK